MKNILVTIHNLLNKLLGYIPENKMDAPAGYFDMTNKEHISLTGYKWLQLNNTSDNKISLSNGNLIYVSSPNFSWNGNTIATQAWVQEKSHAVVGTGYTGEYTSHENPGYSVWTFSNGLVQSVVYHPS